MRLKQYREAAGLSQSELARKARVHPSTVSHVEAGRAYPYPAFRKRVSNVLGLKEYEVFESSPKATSDADGR